MTRVLPASASKSARRARTFSSSWTPAVGAAPAAPPPSSPPQPVASQQQQERRAPYARTWAEAPSSASSAARIVIPSPTKIGVSRSV